VIITAAGAGCRYGQLKQFLLLNGEPVISRTVSVFNSLDCINEIILVLPRSHIDSFKPEGDKITAVVSGGENRQQSVYVGLKAVNRKTDIVLVHDGVRPFVHERVIRAVIDTAAQGFAAVAGVRATDTIKQTDADNFVTATPNRETLWQVQTPQGFPYTLFKQAHEQAEKEGFLGTDDSMLVEFFKLAPVKIVEGDKRNIKITTPEDLFYGEMLIHKGLLP
jgi:2-C-methyl-D-erythritol 4-phosphate cytidylyltransferase